MWSKLNTSGLKGAIGGVAQVWNNLEQSLDAAVGAPPSIDTSSSTSAFERVEETTISPIQQGPVRRASQDLFDNLLGPAASTIENFISKSRSNTPQVTIGKGRGSSIISTSLSFYPFQPRRFHEASLQYFPPYDTITCYH